jgi:hypothetical protein
MDSRRSMACSHDVSVFHVPVSPHRRSKTNAFASYLTNKQFRLKYTLHQEIGLTPSPTCPPGKVVSAKTGCGRSGNKTGSQPRVSPPRRRTEGGFFK